MPLWIFRISTLIGFPFLMYTFGPRDTYSILLAFLAGIIIVCGEYFIRSLKLITVMVGIFGALAGYLLFFLCDYAVIKMDIPQISEHWIFFKPVAAAFFTMLAGFLSIAKVSELEGIRKKGRHNKIADISALMDGRIVDLCETGFLNGTIILPQFVVDKLNVLANSKDLLEKARGRRGLDIVTRLRELKIVPVKITSKEPHGNTPAEQTVSVAKQFKGEIITVDFNINKAAAIEDIPVLNISDLTTALKPVVLPGESISLFIMKEGKEKEQGIAYLDDGTMVVVEEGRKWIGKRAEVSVYSILQTSAGRMIFAKVKPAQEQ